MSTYTTRFSLPEEDGENENLLFASFKQWLQDQPGWLLVLDYLEDIDLIDLVVPPQSSGHVLLTTRKQATGRHAFPIIIKSMDVDYGALFLLRRVKVLWPQDPPEQAPSDVMSKARAIAEVLKGFPLALEQAGAYIEETGCSFARYLSFCEQRRAWLLSGHGQLADDQRQSVISTFDFIFQQVTQKSAVSLDLLRLLAFLHPDAIFDELFLKGAPVLHGTLRSLAADSQKLHQAFAVLLNFSLIYWSDDRTTQQMHRIVQDVLIDTLTLKEQRRWAQLAVRLVNHVFPEVSFDTRNDCQQYLPHAQHCATLITKYQLALKEGALLLERLGTYRFRQASYNDAEKYLLQALHLYERYLSTQTLNRAQTLNSLGLLYRQQARYKEALAHHQRALELRSRTSGQDDPKTMESLHNLAMIYGDLGKYQEAVHLYQSVLSLEELTKGPDHPDVALVLNDWGLLATKRGQYQKAREFYERALSIYELVLGPEHPDVASVLNNLGQLFYKTGNKEHAKKLLQRSLAIREKAFDATHPGIAQSRSNLASLENNE